MKKIDVDNTYNIGLTSQEVYERKKSGNVNKIPKAPSRTLGQIIRANLFTSFNAINVILASIVIISGSPKNAIFMGVIVVNTLIGVYQEVKAKMILEKLSVINDLRAKVVRDNKLLDIKGDEVVIDDIIYLQNGMQIPADAKVVYSEGLEVDESMITGESVSVYKSVGSSLSSGSYVVAGEGYARVKKVGADTYSSKLSQEAKKYKVINSELQKSINKIFRVLIWVIIPVSILLIVTQLKVAGNDWNNAVLGTVSGIVGMVPEGLVLLTSATFTVSVIKLAKHNTLVQQLPATEILARVDMMCIDKTGTITEGNLKVANIYNLSNYGDEYLIKILATLVYNLPGNNLTQKALRDKYKEYYSKDSDVECIKKVPFSSKRKWSGIKFDKLGTWIIGAPDIILKEKYNLVRNTVEDEAKHGNRVLLLAKVKSDTLSDKLDSSIEPQMLISIEDIIRENIGETLEYFNKKNVGVKIISGDNPITVSQIAKKAGVLNYDNYIDGSELPKEDSKLEQVVKEKTIFGRVTPYDKKRIVKALQNLGHTVAMTGDGVNDVLALKESDCGIAMANGDDATKAVSQLVLMTSDFSKIPAVVEEGTKQIQNLERVSELFLSKTIFSIVLSVITAILFLPFPIDPIQLSLVGSCAIGIPAFFLSMLPSYGRVEKHFLKRILIVSIPNGLIMATCTILAFIIGQYRGYGEEYSKTLSLVMFAGIALIILYRVARPLTSFKIALCIMITSAIITSFILPIGRFIFTLSKLRLIDSVICIGAIILIAPLMTKMVDFFAKRLKNIDLRIN